jgi:hypothetical protein
MPKECDGNGDEDGDGESESESESEGLAQEWEALAACQRKERKGFSVLEMVTCDIDRTGGICVIQHQYQYQEMKM